MQKSTLFSSLITSLVFVAAVACAEEGKVPKKIVKWTDSKGIVHYGDTMPAQEVGRSNAELSQDGVTLRRNNSYKTLSQADQAAEVATAEQMRKDSALLASYSSEEEIDVAMARNLQAEQGNLKVLNQRLIETKKTLAQKEEKQAKLQQSGKKTSEYLEEEIKAQRQKITKTEAEIVVSQNNIQQIQTRYAGYKMRYAELRSRSLSSR